MNAYPVLDANAKSEKTGWSRLCLNGTVRHKHLALVELKEQLIIEFSEYENKSSPEKSDFVAECLKSAVRSVIRYSPQARAFAAELVRQIISVDSRWRDFYITPPYLLFHLPSDRHEAGTIHSDAIRGCGEMFTCWTPVNNFSLHHPALSLFEFSHRKLPGLGFRALHKLRLNNRISEISLLEKFGSRRHDLVPTINCSYFWDANLLHMGNLNVGEKSHCAVVFRISAAPLYYEPANRCLEIQEECQSQQPIVSLADLLGLLDDLVAYADTAPCLIDGSNEAFCWITEAHKRKSGFNAWTARHCSFSLALLAQRFPKYRGASALQLLSFLMGKENLIGLERYLESCKDAGTLKQSLAFLASLEPFNTMQELVMLRKFVNDSKFLNLLSDSAILHAWID